MTTKAMPRFQETWCSQCGKGFGPGNSGYSHCQDHRPRRAIEDKADEALSNLEDIQSARTNFKSELDSLVRLYNRLSDDPDYHVSEAIAHIERGIDELTLAANAAEDTARPHAMRLSTEYNRQQAR